MQVPLLPVDEHETKGPAPDENAGDQANPVLPRLPAEIHAQESAGQRLGVEQNGNDDRDAGD